MLKTVNRCTFISIRTLKSIHDPSVSGKEFQKYPFDFYRFPYTQWYDVYPGLDVNSRLIAVQGSIGTNKKSFGERFAKYFNLKYVDDVNEDTIFTLRVKNFLHDLKAYDNLLPPGCQTYGKEKLFNDPDPIKNGKPLLLQKYIFQWRFYNSCKAMSHIFNTTQGVVQKNHPWFDNVMALTLRDMGMMSEKAYKFYNLARCEWIPKLFKPHIVVFLKGSPKTLRERLAKQGRWEADASNLTDEFFETYERNFMNYYNRVLGENCKLYVINLDDTDIDNENDFISEADAISEMNHDYFAVNYTDPIYRDWKNACMRRIVYQRWRTRFSSASELLWKDRDLSIPIAVTEGSFTHHQQDIFSDIFFNDERFKNDCNYDPKYSSFKDRYIGSWNYNYYNMLYTPHYDMMFDYCSESYIIR